MQNISQTKSKLADSMAKYFLQTKSKLADIINSLRKFISFKKIYKYTKYIAF